MLLTLRIVVSLGLFIWALVLLGLCITDEFSLTHLLFSLLLFAASYYFWPSSRRGAREHHNVLDLLELLIEFPMEAILWFFKLILRFFKHGDGGIDIG